MSAALKPGAPLAFTYHHNDIKAYYPVAVAILDAGLACSGSVPCPAEMGASIHISGTGSSIIDTVFVCRSTGTVPKRWITRKPEEIAALVRDDVEKLRLGDVKPTQGDMRCVAYGHAIRLAVWHLRKDWVATVPVDEKIGKVANWIDGVLGGTSAILGCLDGKAAPVAAQQHMILREARENYGSKESQISF